MGNYTFGDTDLAGERLRILDAVFAPTTDALLSDLDVRPSRVADLGCGPGATTARLVRRFPSAPVVGIDASTAFVLTARTAVPSARFVTADVTAPLPGAPYDLVYARFLLAHLPDIAGAIRTWMDALAPGGLLVCEETESISSTDRDFEQYEALVRTRVGTGGAVIYAGPLITPNLPVELDIVRDRVIALDLTAGQAAAMFWRNLSTWGANAVADGLLTDAERADLLVRLRARENDTTCGRLAWTHRQLVARRRTR